MRLILDTNILISAFIKDSVTREIIIESSHDLLSPDYIESEIERHKDLVEKKSGLGKEKTKFLINLLLAEIEIVPLEEYRGCLTRAKEMIGKTDLKDIPFLALALEKECGIWSDDKDFEKQEKVEIFTTKEIVELTPEI